MSSSNTKTARSRLARSKNSTSASRILPRPGSRSGTPATAPTEAKIAASVAIDPPQKRRISSAGSVRRCRSSASIHTPYDVASPHRYARAERATASCSLRALISAAKRVLPTPAVPDTRATRNSPERARSISAASAARWRVLPTNGGAWIAAPALCPGSSRSRSGRPPTGLPDFRRIVRGHDAAEA